MSGVARIEEPAMAHKDWNKQRSTHARVLESLEDVISRHPAGANLRTVEPTPEVDPDRPSNVIDLRSRFTLARSAGGSFTPDDAA